MIVLEDDHSSPVLEWHSRAEPQGFAVETIKRPDDGDWTSAVLAAIERSGAPPVSLASISSVHWSDGGLIDVDKVGAALRQRGAAFLIDATQGAGVLAMDVKRLDPDFVLFPTYKWLLGPYGRAFFYVARRHQGGIPLEQISAGRRNVRAENPVYFTDLGYVSDARRFDMGERDYFISMEMASIGMEMLAAWGCAGRCTAFGDADGADRGGRARYWYQRAGTASARAAYTEPEIPGRDAGGAGRGSRQRGSLRRVATGAHAHLAARLQ